MDGSYENEFDENRPPVRELTKGQRRMLGVLVEKALTTPDQYPLTLKAATSGANQKSNRDPVTNFTEGAVWDLLDELRELGLVAVVHTESGRTERFRHYVRKRYPFTEPQLAIMAELMLRGRQQLGELRSRASRMVPIDSQDDLRDALASLLEQGYIQASGPLERRGIEVDHNLYTASEGGKLEQSVEPAEEPQRFVQQSQPSPNVTSHHSGSSELSELKQLVAVMKSELESQRQQIDELRDDLSDLRKSLGA